MDAQIKHYFSDGVYAKEQYLPAGCYAMTHSHKYSHLSILAKGVCIITVDGIAKELTAPECVEIKAGVAHRIEATRDSVWYCVHHTDEKDPDKIDAQLIMDCA